MNYLAHIYLSGDNDFIKIGNFIADFVKGEPYKQFPNEIAFGIALHRKIDRFTDTHALVRESRLLFFEEFSHYSGVITDVLFDYFLAKNWSSFTVKNLSDFVQSFYDLLKENWHVLPKAVQRMYPHMIKENWLLNYQHLDGIENILFQMNSRTANKPKLHNSIATLHAYHDELEDRFFMFFEELQTYVQELISEFSQ